MTHNELPLFYVFHFYFFGLVAIVSALAFVTRKSPVAAAMWLVNVMFSLAVLYVLLDAQFIGTMQVLVYAGAIMVVFLFVIMLLNLGHASELADARSLWWKLAAGAVGLALLAQVFTLTKTKLPEAFVLPENTVANQFAKDGAIAPLAGPLFHEYLLAFEVTSVLLLAAVVGAVVLGKRKERSHAG
ncbi:MAG: NADH-quinone oxidoreductase subunit J [bacterium]